MDFVISNPPLEKGLLADTTDATAQRPRVLTIVQKISHKPKRQGGGAVVVGCHLDADRSTQYVAKIYDGFEYELGQPGSTAVDCMFRADRDYSREAAAYENIPARFQGSIVPQYFGSWTFPLPTNVPERPRWVRMVLVEYVHGECMLDMILHSRGATRSNPEPRLKWPNETPTIDYRLLPSEEERLDVLARIVEAEAMIWWYGSVKHGDIAPRNVIISCSGPPSKAVSRVTLIDFNNAYVLPRCDRGRKTMKSLGIGEGLPLSPIERWWFGDDFSYGGEYTGWIPERWCIKNEDGNRDADASYAIATKWLIDRWKTSPKFQPPSEEFLDPSYHENLGEPFSQLVEGLKSFLAERRQASGQKKGQPQDGGR
jgi:serine/threonine protein kinase